MEEFSIPLNREDLLASSGGDGYKVEEIFEPSMLDSKLQESKAESRTEGPTSIINFFDTYYSVLHHLKRLKDQIKATAWMQVLSDSNSHINSLPMILHDDGIDQELRVKQLCTLKMEVYILTQFMEAFESDSMKPTTSTDATKKGKNKKKLSDSWDWTVERTNGLTAINLLLQLDIQRLWEPPIVEDEFVNIVSGVCYKILENPQITRQKEDKELIFNILGQLVKRYNHQLGATLRIIQLLQHFEHLVSPLSQMLEIFVNSFGCKNIIGDVLREIGRIDGEELSRDTSGTRSFSLFLVETTDRIPSCVLPNISLLMSHLDGDSYTMRNGVLGVFSEIVIKVLSREDLDENMKKSRESFLDKLEEHIHDIHAFVRSKVLQLWINIAHEKAIPISRQSRIIDLIIGRLHDKSSQVRKYAVQFLKISLIGNPFAAKLPLEQLETSLEKEEFKLKELQPNEEDVASIQENQHSEEWNTVSKELKNYLKKFFSDNAMEEGIEHVEFFEDDEDVIVKTILKIQTLLQEKKYSSAVQLLTVAMEKLEEHEEFQVNMENENKEIFENTEEEDDSEAENVNTPGQEEEIDQKIKKHFFLLRRFFHAKQDGDSEDSMEMDLASVTQKAQEPKEVDHMKNIEIDKQKVLVNYLKDCVKFSKQMKEAVPILCQLLQSKILTDVLETIDFFIAAHEFGVSQSEEGIRRMANLIWSRDPAIKKAVVSAFEKLYIDVSCETQRSRANVIVSGFMSLISNANLGELTSLDELVSELMKMELIPQEVIQLLWQKFSLKLANTSVKEQRCAIMLIAMIANAEKEIIKSNLSVLADHGLVVTNGDLNLAKQTCHAILKVVTKTKLSSGKLNEPYRLPKDHALFTKLSCLLVDEFQNLNGNSWIPFCEVAISVIYQLSEFPDLVCSEIMKKLTEALFTSTSSDISQMNVSSVAGELDEIFPKANQLSEVHPVVLARLLQAAGQMALLQLYHLDVSIFAELKRRHLIKEEDKEKRGKRTSKLQASGGRKSLRDSTASSTSNNKQAQDSGMDDEMGVGGAVAEDAEAEYIRKICETELVTGENLLSIFPQMASYICHNPTKYPSLELQTAAAMSLSKFMIISSEFCDANLQLLFTILEKSEHPQIRANTIIALGDLTFRFPNSIEPWTAHLYSRLRDESTQVRRTAVTILSHLILNDMVKVKGQISEMAVCLEDKQEKIASAAKMFFFELAQKGNALYNVAPDIISRLSDPDCGVSEQSFRSILKYLFQFIQKDKQAESLVEKLCYRFRATRTERQWRDLSYCLSLLPYNEKAFRKLMENIRCYHDKLSDDDVFACFTNIITKSKKFAKIELKTLVEEFEATIQGYHSKGLEENADFDKAAKALSLAASQTNTKTVPARNKPQKKANTRNKKARHNSDDESDEELAGAMEKENKTPLPGKGKRKHLTRNKKTVKTNPVFSSDDDDIFD